ncbi:uncharacterized protein GGS25DRAFT_523492 [Hypoxylon fragiforme]|uniref:uncharacterized protein n=1 Tax=Hypoxylon fragiforme TaxID=63214 RepID=UPI0020C67110|nr:uncharacterized protein GGS25DRAFT_523492 [Hypoxylon fragiforme]KAI2605818.1 hypothetical protein GGS25DRAFT_523492 [Hypoxylon fragiforme]
MVVACKDVLALGAAVVIATARLAGAAPLDYFPLNSQLPPVARISQAFEFTFSPLTFYSPFNLTYRLENAPAWLSIDSSSRRLYGTPSDDDIPPGEVVGIPIELVAEDETGATTTSPTIVVSRNPPPTVAIPVSEQLPKFGTYIAPSSLHLHPSSPFSFSFDEHTFRTGSGDGGLNYYAVSDDNVPLPSWITFDAGTLAFSGETPPFESLIQPPQAFTFQLVASDVVGFASISVPFSLVVGVHELTAEPPVIRLNATQGKLLKYDGLPTVLKLDGEPLKEENITTIAALDLPSWLSFDNETWELNGTPDSNAESTNVTIAVVDQHFDDLNLTVAIRFGIFLSDLPDLDLTAGDDFSFDLKKYLSRPSDIQVTIDDDQDAPWARFNSSSLILSGTVPESFTAKSRTAPSITFQATSKSTNETETQVMNIRIAALPPTATPEPNNPPPDSSNGDWNRNLLWLLVIPIFLVFIGIIVLLFYVRRRRQGRQEHKRINIREVSGPIPGSFMANQSTLAPDSDRDFRKMMDLGASRPSDGSVPARDSHATSDRHSSRSPSLTGSMMPHAMMAMYSRARSPKHSVILEASSSSSTGRDGEPSPRRIGEPEEGSLLSDTSLGEGDEHIAESHSYVLTQRPQEEISRTLQVPTYSEPFSIQTTPEIAYIAGGKYDSSSEDAVPPPVGYTARRRSEQQQQQPRDSGLSLRGVGKRLSNLWNKQSTNQTLDERRRDSIGSNTTTQTTRTSILTSGVSGFSAGAEEEARASTNIVARPTIIHIPSRPGEVRQLSRRIDGSSPLFGGRSLTRSPRNFGLAQGSPEFSIFENPEPPPTLEGFTEPRDSDSSWDRHARDSLGIAYKDLITEPALAPSQREPSEEIAQENNWIMHDLLSPGQWPQQPNIAVNMVGIARTSPANISSELPRLPPPMAYGAFGSEAKGRAIEERRPSQGMSHILYHTPSIGSRSDQTYTSRAMTSQTPSPENGWAPPMRPLPQTPTRPIRVPLGDRPNEIFYGEGQGSKKSWKTIRSMKSAKSMHSVWINEDDDDEDAWEDIRPPTTIDGWDDYGDSEGSFAVYI